MSLRTLLEALKGGSGSGNFGHSGRPGKRGGSAGGKFALSSQQAAEWNKDSALKAVLFHGTDKDRFASIKSNGFSLDFSRSTSGHYGIFGEGVYLTTDPAKAREYGIIDWSTGEIPTLKLVVNVKNVANEDDFIRIAKESGYYKSSKMSNPDKFITDALKSHGYDAVHINDEVVVFDPNNIRVIDE